jgi:hypothetical protein
MQRQVWPFYKMGRHVYKCTERYNFDDLSSRCYELIAAKKKEANRFIHNWPEEKVQWRMGDVGRLSSVWKKCSNFEKADSKYTPKTQRQLNLDDVKENIKQKCRGHL